MGRNNKNKPKVKLKVKEWACFVVNFHNNLSNLDFKI